MRTIALTAEQQQTLRGENGKPVEVVDPATEHRYVLLEREQYERVRALLGWGVGLELLDATASIPDNDYYLPRTPPRELHPWEPEEVQLLQPHPTMNDNHRDGSSAGWPADRDCFHSGSLLLTSIAELTSNVSSIRTNMTYDPAPRQDPPPDPCYIVPAPGH